MKSVPISSIGTAIVLTAMSCGSVHANPLFLPQETWQEADVASAIPKLFCYQDFVLTCEAQRAECGTLEEAHWVRLDLDLVNKTVMFRSGDSAANAVPFKMSSSTIDTAGQGKLTLNLEKSALVVGIRSLSRSNERISFSLTTKRKSLDLESWFGVCQRAMR
jgi:hypothetical protein